MGRRTPQEKKQLSYEKDRRNNYGENDKSSRKNIARNKRIPHRANRQRDQQLLAAALGTVDEQVESNAEQQIAARRPKTRRKWRDMPLGIYVEETLRRRATREDARSGR